MNQSTSPNGLESGIYGNKSERGRVSSLDTLLRLTLLPVGQELRPEDLAALAREAKQIVDEFVEKISRLSGMD